MHFFMKEGRTEGKRGGRKEERAGGREGEKERERGVHIWDNLEAKLTFLDSCERSKPLSWQVPASWFPQKADVA